MLGIGIDNLGNIFFASLLRMCMPVIMNLYNDKLSLLVI